MANHGGKREGAGRKPYAPTPEQRAMVRDLAAARNSQNAIAAALGITTDTLAKYFPEELRAGREARAARRCPTCGARLRRALAFVS